MAWKTTEIGQDPSPPPSSAQTLVGTSSQGSRSASQSTVGPQASGSSLSRKRSNTQPSQDSQSRKRTRPNSPDFTLSPGCIEETADLRLPGELEAGLEADTKPVRYLDSFTIYDPRHGEFRNLADLESDDNDYQFEAAGFIWPVLVDEDEDDSEDEDEEDAEGYSSSVTNDEGPGPSQPGKGMMSSRTYAHITAIVKIWWDPVAEEDSRIWIQTLYAWYILRAPAPKYTSEYLKFFVPRRITQLVLSNTDLSLEEFVEEKLITTEEFGHVFTKEDLKEATEMIEEEAFEEDLQSAELVLQITGKGKQKPRRVSVQRIQKPRRVSVQRIQRPARHHHPPPTQTRTERKARAPDPERRAIEAQSTTQVLPLIAKIARPHVRGSLEILGARGSAESTRVCTLDLKDKDHVCKDMACPVFAAKAEHRLAIRALERMRSTRAITYSSNADRHPHSVTIGDKVYKVGDTILTPKHKPTAMPTRDSLKTRLTTPEDLFTLARILFIDRPKGRVHLQLYVPARETMMNELAAKREVFATEKCLGDVRVKDICGVVGIVRDGEGEGEPEKRRLRFAYEPALGSFSDIPREDFLGPPPAAKDGQKQYCCRLHAFREREEPLPYHRDDYVLYKAQDDTKGPARIGQIRSIQGDRIKVRRLQRARDLPRSSPSEGSNFDRDVYLCDGPPTSISKHDILRSCLVVSLKTYERLPPSIHASPYTFVAIGKIRNGQRHLSTSIDVPKCTKCKQTMEKARSGEATLTRRSVLDLCAGVGAFGSALAEGSGGSLKVTHAIELSPSAARTIEANHSDVKVYNQCVNTMLRYAVHMHDRKTVDAPPKQLWDGQTEVSDPPRPGQIRVVTAGFPCQSFSSVNRHRTRDDPRNNIFLNVLSWVAHLKPEYVFLENVRGFVYAKLSETHGGPPIISGGPLKLCVRILVELGYQIRFSLLQAAHYGGPQDRLRFFLVAARSGRTLPHLPQPTHLSSLPVKCGSIKMPLELAGGAVRIEAVNPGTSRAPHRAVTIGDAIGDLRRFHWSQEPDRRVNDGIPLLPADGIGRIGYVNPQDAYEFAPRTTFQANARQKPATGDIQHYTAQFNEDTAKKVVGIPMVPNADARHLPRAHHTFMLHNPMSANGQNGFTKAYFGRLDEKALFMTVTTQMKPTAKQSRCLNPWCRRVITVRELARAQGFPDHFVFKSVKGEHDINTLQKQIGNAVAWPVAAALGRELKDAMLADEARNRAEAEVIYSD